MTSELRPEEGSRFLAQRPLRPLWASQTSHSWPPSMRASISEYLAKWMGTFVPAAGDSCRAVYPCRAAYADTVPETGGGGGSALNGLREVREEA